MPRAAHAACLEWILWWWTFSVTKLPKRKNQNLCDIYAADVSLIVFVVSVFHSQKVDDNPTGSVNVVYMKELIRFFFVYLERLVSTALLVGMAVVIMLAAWSFLRLTYFVASDPGVDILYTTFQTLFDRLLAAIIALELARSVLLLVEGHRGLVQVRIILVIGLLAVVRKLILIELEAADATLVLALAAAILALAASLALVMYIDPKKDRDE